MNRIDGFNDKFRDYTEISLKDIFDYFHSQNKTNEKSIRAMLSRWTKQGVLSRVKKGVYILTDERKKLYKLSADKIQKRLAKLFEAQYPELKYSIWDTQCLNNLMIHQHFTSFYLFETENDILDSVFYLFKDNQLNVFMSDDETTLQRYMYNAKAPIVLRKLVSRSPLARKDQVSHPTLEKILVDLFVDRTLFNFIQGTELSNIYNKSFEYYVVNITKLLNYADRRKAKEEIKDYIRNTVHNIEVTRLL